MWFIFCSSRRLIDLSQNYDQDPEYLTLPAGAPDGVYIFQIAPWSVASSAIDWLLELKWYLTLTSNCLSI